MADVTERLTAAQYRQEMGQGSAAPARKPLDQRERRLQIEVVDWLRECTLTMGGAAILWTHLGNERRDRADAILQYRQGVLAGAPDLLFWVGGGRVVNIELKDPTGGKLSREQLIVANRLELLGHRHRVVRSIEEVRAELLIAGVQIVETPLARARRESAT